MRKSAEQEHQIRLAIRDVVARNPLISVLQLQSVLKERGFKTAEGNALHWHYLAKLVRKLNREKALAVDLQKVNERIAETKERYRIMVEMLWRIIDYKMEYIELYNLFPPKNDERIKAANTLVKLDLAILKAEMDAGIFDRKLGSVDVNVYRAAPLDPEKASQIADAFKRWGIDLTLPNRKDPVLEIPIDNTTEGREVGDIYKTDYTGAQRPKLIEAQPADATNSPAQDSGQGVPGTP